MFCARERISEARRRPLSQQPLSLTVTALLLLLTSITVPTAASSQVAGAPEREELPRFKPDDPIREDPDRVLLFPEPAEREISKAIDLLQKTFTSPEGGSERAANINTIGEVPDSSWFENRMSHRVMTIEELVRGPNQGDGPDVSTPWRIVGAKTAGITPGFRIVDARGDLYFIKFDPLNWPQMATSTEVVGTKFFYAFGYHTPENYLVRWSGEYTLDRESEVLWDDGHRTLLNEAYINELLENVPVRPDGTIQVVASKGLLGSPIGPFDFQGTRSDDPNDIFPHEDRRELRAYRVFTAWMNHNDSDSVNTLDMWIDKDEDSVEDGRGYVRHNLIDFGTVMGSGAWQPHARRIGNEYYIEFTPALKSAATLGIWDRPWRKVHYDIYPSVGRFESDYFQPETWKPDYPNPAFDRMTLQDALWATRTVMRFTDEMIRAMVACGRYDDPAAQEHVIETLIERRDKTVRYWLAQINPVDGFEVADAPDGEHRLAFTNLGVEAGLAGECSYGYAWHTFGNGTGVYQAIGSPGLSPRPELRIPSSDAEFIMVKLSSSCPDQPKWTSEVDVYLQNGPAPSVVGIERFDPQD